MDRIFFCSLLLRGPDVGSCGFLVDRLSYLLYSRFLVVNVDDSKSVFDPTDYPVLGMLIN